MSIKKKILVVALALGTVGGFGMGIKQMKHHRGACQRAAWSQVEHHRPCGRSGDAYQRWQAPKRGHEAPPAPQGLPFESR